MNVLGESQWLSIFKYNGKCFTYGVYFFLLKRLISQSMDPQYYIYLFSMGFKISNPFNRKKVYTICVEIIIYQHFVSLFLCFFVCLFLLQLVGSSFPTRDWIWAMGSSPPNHQGAPIYPPFKIISGSLSYKCTINWVKKVMKRIKSNLENTYFTMFVFLSNSQNKVIRVFLKILNLKLLIVTFRA